MLLHLPHTKEVACSRGRTVRMAATATLLETVSSSHSHVVMTEPKKVAPTMVPLSMAMSLVKIERTVIDYFLVFAMDHNLSSANCKPHFDGTNRAPCIMDVGQCSAVGCTYQCTSLSQM